MNARGRHLPPFAAVVLAGGTAARMDGVDKATLQLAGRSLLDHVLDAVRGAVEVVVVGDPTTTERRVRFAREEPAQGGPAAALLAGRDALGPQSTGTTLAVLACDMPQVDAATVLRLREAAIGGDGACLTGPDGRRQLALVLALDRLDAISPEAATRPGLALHRLLAGLHLVDVLAQGEEHLDVDTWADLHRMSRRGDPR